MRHKLKVIGLFVFLTAVSISAQDYNDALRLSDPAFLSSPRALGMGNAYTALSNDFSASLFNPAGFAFVKKTEFSGSIDYNSLSNKTTFFNQQSEFSNNNTSLNQAGFVFPFPTLQGSFALAFGYNQINKFDHSVKFSGYNHGNNSMIQDLTLYNDPVAYETGVSYHLNDVDDATFISGELNQSGEIISSGGLDKWTLAGAVEFQRNFFLGFSISRISGEYKRDREYWEDDVNDFYTASLQLDPTEPATADFQTFYFNDVIKWDVGAWDFTLGLITKLNDNLNFGFTFKLPRTYKIEETYFVDATADFGTGIQFFLDPPIENKYEYKISTPSEFTAGLAYNMNNVTLSMDAKLIDYTQMEFESHTFLEDWELSDRNSDIKDLFRTVVNLNAGLEYIIPRTGIALRAGVMWLPSPFKDDDTDFDKKIVTTGIGFETSNNISFNLGYAYGWWKTFGDNYGINGDGGFSRTYQDITHHNLIMGIKYFF